MIGTWEVKINSKTKEQNDKARMNGKHISGVCGGKRAKKHKRAKREGGNG